MYLLEWTRDISIIQSNDCEAYLSVVVLYLNLLTPFLRRENPSCEGMHKWRRLYCKSELAPS